MQTPSTTRLYPIAGSIIGTRSCRSPGCGDGTDEVRFYESSGATAIRGTVENPEFIPGPFAWLRVGENAAHMTRREVVQLQGYIARWLLLNPEDEGTNAP